MIADKIEPRELRSWERKSIKKLVQSSCANFDKEYGCLPMDCPCYMCHKYYTGAFCLYFKQNVLPLHLELSASLEEIALEKKRCKGCQKPFVPSSKEWYCSAACRQQARKTTFRKSQQKHRSNVNI